MSRVNLAGLPALGVSLVVALLAAQPPKSNLYLLAGTPMGEGVAPGLKYPVTLYTAGPKRELETVRQVFSKSQALADVRDDLAGRLYVVSEFDGMSIIHERDPKRDDTVGRGYFDVGMTPSSWGIVAPPGEGSSAIILETATKEQDGKIHFVGYKIHLIAGSPTVAPRISEGQWSLYRWFRYSGQPVAPPFGGSALLPGGNVVNGQIVVPVSGAPPPGEQLVHGELVPAPITRIATGTLGPIPPNLPAAVGTRIETVSDAWGTVSYPVRTLTLVADTPRFFAFSAHSSDSKAWPVPVYVLDRTAGSWQVVDCRFVRLWPRVFASWIATTDEEPNPTGRESPGLENERSLSARAYVTSDLPQVRGMYGTETFMPGKLLLQNLADNRKITIDTAQQDSEVLDVRNDGLVLYRVNDEVFAAQIAGDKLSASTLVVKGDDVPEIHWVFWSDAPAELGK